MQDDPAGAQQDAIVWTTADDHRDGTVRRRLTGLTVIGLALVALMLTTAVPTRSVSGATRVPPPPQIGDCLSTAITDRVWEQLGSDDPPLLASEPCTGSRAGEVVSVDGQSGSEWSDCWTPSLEYLDLPGRTGENRAAWADWSTRTLVSSFTFGHSPLQVRAGQVWSACVLVGIDLPTFQPRPLTESPRGAAQRGGSSFDPFAFCTDEPLSPGIVPCSERHRYEMIADAVDLSPPEADTLKSCQALTSELTGLDDPSADGRLRVELIGFTYDPDDATPRRASYHQARTGGGSVTCVVSPTAPGEMLTSTLIGLGDTPLPIG